MARFFAWASLVVGGIIIADFVTHPQGTKALGSQVNGLWGTTTRALNPSASKR